MKNILRFRFEERVRYRLRSANSLPEAGFVSRGATTFDIFRRGVSPVETDPGEPSDSGRRIEPSTVSLIVD